MIFKRILFLLVVFFSIFAVRGNTRTDELRRTLNHAPDSAKAAILVNLAKTFKTINADSCAFYARKASDAARKMKQDAVWIEAEIILDRIAFENKEYVKSTGHRKNILDATLRLHEWNLAAQAYYDIAQTWLFRYNYAEAIDYLKKGLEITKERNQPELLRDYYQSLIAAYQKLHNINAVSEYYALLVDVNRQIDAKAHNEQIAALQAKSGTRTPASGVQANGQMEESSPSPITGIVIIWAILATLSLAVVIIFYRYRLTAINTKNQKVMEETVRDINTVKINQTAIFQFLTQYAYTGINKLHENIGRFTSEQGIDLPSAMDDALGRINSDVFALYGFFQNFLLLLEAQSGQLKPELNTVNIPQLATNLLADYESFAAANDIQLVNDVQNNVFAMADERMIDTVLRNMMSNAFKYAPKGGLITLGAKENYENMEVWVTDDGIGLDSEQASKLFELSENLTLPGIPDIKGYGLGLAVCKALVETCKGRIWAETKPGEGFCIRFSLPKAVSREIMVQI